MTHGMQLVPAQVAQRDTSKLAMTEGISHVAALLQTSSQALATQM
jgi:hypothetical protein